MANLIDTSTIQKPGNRSGSLSSQAKNEMTFGKPEDLIAYQKYAFQELQSSMIWLKNQNEIVGRNVVILTDNLGVCSAQLQYFSSRCNDLNDLCKERREEIEGLQKELDKVNIIREDEQEKASLALEMLRKEKYASRSNFVVCLCILVCIIFTWLVSIISKTCF